MSSSPALTRISTVALGFLSRRQGVVSILIKLGFVFAVGGLASAGIGFGQDYFRDHPEAAQPVIDVLKAVFTWGFVGALACYAVAWAMRTATLPLRLSQPIERTGTILLTSLIAAIVIVVLVMAFVVAYQCLVIMAALLLTSAKWVLSALGLIG